MTASNTPPVFSLHEGSLPLLISIPHMGTRIPDDIAATMTPLAQRTEDCDWHLDRLYGFARGLGASILMPTYARYVIDLNRPPDGANLYPGQDTTGLLPVDTFDKEPLYLDGHLPGEAEVARRRDAYWKPYHEALAAHLAALKVKHGKVLLWEAHSIRSHVPRFFDGFQLRHVERRECRNGAGGGVGRGGQTGWSLLVDRKWPLQGRLYHASVWSTGARHTRGATRIDPDYVYGRADAVCV
jgi:N-formylglutamate amidohydrolase